MKQTQTRRGFTQTQQVVIKNKVILNLIQDLPCTLLRKHKENDKRGRCQIKFGMTALFDNGLTSCGFTLIELLVVVLIIGILAAVALPQYQKAVTRSRLAKLKPIVRSLYEAQTRYFLENGTYGNRISALDIEIGRTPSDSDDRKRNFEWGGCHVDVEKVLCIDKTALIGYFIWLRPVEGNVNKQTGVARCIAGRNSVVAKTVCNEETGSLNTAGGYSFNSWAAMGDLDTFVYQN